MTPPRSYPQPHLPSDEQVEPILGEARLWVTPPEEYVLQETDDYVTQNSNWLVLNRP
jgi:hypothetical protein